MTGKSETDVEGNMWVYVGNLDWMMPAEQVGVFSSAFSMALALED